MKRLCVFYYRADEWLGKPVEWIVCKKCQHVLRAGEKLHTPLSTELFQPGPCNYVRPKTNVPNPWAELLQCPACNSVNKCAPLTPHDAFYDVKGLCVHPWHWPYDHRTKSGYAPDYEATRFAMLYGVGKTTLQRYADKLNSPHNQTLRKRKQTLAKKPAPTNPADWIFGTRDPAPDPTRKKGKRN